jgi:hypothetical protein
MEHPVTAMHGLRGLNYVQRAAFAHCHIAALDMALVIEMKVGQLSLTTTTFANFSIVLVFVTSFQSDGLVADHMR